MMNHQSMQCYASTMFHKTTLSRVCIYALAERRLRCLEQDGIISLIDARYRKNIFSTLEERVLFWVYLWKKNCVLVAFTGLLRLENCEHFWILHYSDTCEVNKKLHRLYLNFEISLSEEATGESAAHMERGGLRTWARVCHLPLRQNDIESDSHPKTNHDLINILIDIHMHKNSAIKPLVC